MVSRTVTVRVRVHPMVQNPREMLLSGTSSPKPAFVRNISFTPTDVTGDFLVRSKCNRLVFLSNEILLILNFNLFDFFLLKFYRPDFLNLHSVVLGYAL